MSAGASLADSAGIVLAHGGGAPEALTLGLPILVVLAFVYFEMKARKKERNQDQDGDRDGAGDRHGAGDRDGDEQ